MEPQQRPEFVQALASLDSFLEVRIVECEEEEIGGIDGGSLVDGGGEVEESVGRPSGRRVTMTVLKMSVVVILALGTKKLAVGITMSILTKQTALNPPRAPTPKTLSNASVEEIQIAESQFVG